MGVAQSRELSNEIAASVDQGRGLANLLEDPKFIRHYQAPCAALPVKARRLLLTNHQSRDKRGQNYLLKIQQVREKDICISEGLKPYYESWKQLKGFFNHLPGLQGLSAVPQVYQELRQMERRVDDPIRQRLYSVALFDLRSLVDEKVSLKLNLKVKQKLVQIISESPAVEDSLEDVVKWTELYLKFGERMKEIAMRNGGLGALILIPPWLLSVRQWAREVNAKDFDLGVQHLQSIGLMQKAQEAGAHAVAGGIQRHILQEFTSGLERCRKGHEQGTNEDAEEESRDDGRSQNTGLPNLSDESQGFHKGPEHLGQVTSAGTTPMIADHQQYHPRISIFDDGGLSAPNGISPMEVLSQAASVVTRESGQRDEGRGLGPTVHDLQILSCRPFSVHAVGTQQLRDFESNETILRQDRYTVADGHDLNHRMTNTQGPHTRQERSQSAAIPLFNDSTYDQSSSHSFISGASDIVDARSHADPPNNQYFSQAFEPYNPYFPQAIDFEGHLFTT